MKAFVFLVFLRRLQQQYLLIVARRMSSEHLKPVGGIFSILDTCN